MNILDPSTEEKIKSKIIPAVLQGQYQAATAEIANALEKLYASIPDDKRISYGKVYTVKVLSNYLYNCLVERGADVYTIATNLFTESEEMGSRGVALGILSFYGLENHEKVLPYFETTAASKNWDVREFAQMFFRKLIKKYPAEAKTFLLHLVNSEDANVRRFVGETLRPVQENRWFYTNPEYSLSILRHLFKEHAPYPRTSVGNNLSDLARQLPEVVYALAKELVESGDKDSYWIAYRACRNLVKKEPVRVMDLLRIDEYRYKKAAYKRVEI